MSNVLLEKQNRDETSRPVPSRWLRRTYFVVALFVWYVCIGIGFFSQSSLYLLLTFGFAPVALPAIVMGISWRVFGFSHSDLGSRVRTPIPADEMGRPQRPWPLRGVYFVGQNGLGIRYPFLGDVYIPYETIDQLSVEWINVSLWHHFDEIRSPVIVPRSIGDQVMACLAAKP